MGIEKIDSNFAAAQITADGEKLLYTLPCAPFDLYGVYFDEKNQRFFGERGLNLAEGT